jgi:hypothetical protein
MAAKKEIGLGSQVRVEIVKTPTSAAARKTLVRVLAKDPEVSRVKSRDKLARSRSVRVKQRGGRPWEHRPAMRVPVDARVGAAGTVKATADVLRDLESVSRFVKVTAAR